MRKINGYLWIIVGMFVLGTCVSLFVSGINEDSNEKNIIDNNNFKTSEISDPDIENKIIVDKSLNKLEVASIGKKGINFSVTADKVLYHAVKGKVSKKYMLNESDWKDLMNLKKGKNESTDALAVHDFVIKKRTNYEKVDKINGTAKIEAKVEAQNDK